MVDVGDGARVTGYLGGRPPKMLGVVIPVHNEEHLLVRCLDAVLVLRRDPLLLGEPVEVVIVLDACTDGSEAIVAQTSATRLCVEARSVGAARAAGARHLLDRGARWLAFTDADTVVSPTWLSSQLALGADLVCGTITVDDWSEHPPEVGARFATEYVDACGHRHIHGANLGVSREAYLAVGGFRSLESEEDVALVRALSHLGATIAWSSRPRVTTSARASGRAPGGFADAIRRHRDELLERGVSAAEPSKPFEAAARSSA